MTPFRHDWYKNNDGQVIIGITHNIEFEMTPNGMLSRLVDVIDDTIVYESVINYQEEFNILMDEFFKHNKPNRNFVFTKQPKTLKS